MLKCSLWIWPAEQFRFFLLVWNLEVSKAATMCRCGTKRRWTRWRARSPVHLTSYLNWELWLTCSFLWAKPDWGFPLNCWTRNSVGWFSVEKRCSFLTFFSVQTVFLLGAGKELDQIRKKNFFFSKHTFRLVIKILKFPMIQKKRRRTFRNVLKYFVLLC